MREVKFRAWDGERLRDVWSMGWVEGEMDYIGTPKYNGPAEDCELMQYTGLKDKDNKEIYEGDIVLLKNEFTTWKGTVVFDEGAFKLSIKHSWGTSVEHFNKTNVFSDMGARIQLNNIYLVVGNIYENPELLGDSQ